MLNIIVLSLVLSSVTSLSKVEMNCNNNYCIYSNVFELTTAANASGVCLMDEMQGWLLEVYNESVKELVDEFIMRYNLSWRFILLSTKISLDWMWTDQTPFFSNSNVQLYNPINLTNIQVAYITKSSQSEDKLSGYFVTSVNSSFAGVLCQVENNFQCSNKSQSLVQNEKCYFPLENKNSINWYEAQNKCIKQGASLAVFGDLELTGLDQTWVQSLEDGGYWVGLAKNQFIWNHANKLLNYSNWFNNQPLPDIITNNCLIIDTMDPSGRKNYWRNIPCGGTYTVLCMKENDKSSTVTTTTKSNANRNATVNNDLTTNQKIGIGVGVGVPLFVLLLAAVVVVVVVVWMKHKKKGCFRSVSPANSIIHALDTPNEMNTIPGLHFTNIVNINKIVNISGNNNIDNDNDDDDDDDDDNKNYDDNNDENNNDDNNDNYNHINKNNVINSKNISVTNI